MKIHVEDKVKVIFEDNNYGCNGIIYWIESNGIGYPLKCHLILDNGINTWYYDNNLELIEENKMKYNIGDKVKTSTGEEGYISSISKDELRCTINNGFFKFAIKDLILITDKKYITLADIKRCNPCNSKEYVDLLETCGNLFEFTFEELTKMYPTQKNWIESNLSEFKEKPIYNGKFKVKDIVYFITGRIGCWDKGTIENIVHDKINFRFKINGFETRYKENELFSSLSDLKKYWHKQITDIKDMSEERKCKNCEHFINEYVPCKNDKEEHLMTNCWKAKEIICCATCDYCKEEFVCVGKERKKSSICINEYKCPISEDGYKYWKAKEEKKNLCDKCVCTCKELVHPERMITCSSLEEKSCYNCGNSNISIGEEKDCYCMNIRCKPEFLHWKLKEK